ncbi:putative transcriptional regulator [Neisseria mucosa]|nr:putative transcriptional regulator [Neisseria mucosa]SUA94144.1 putative transcriptional regulator [Neisseria mucosa]SUA94162.1 putative transcriptional regulator [Neisseria mucosa]
MVSLFVREIHMTFKSRLQLLWPDSTLEEIASKIDMSYMGLNKVFAKDGLPKAETLIKIQDVTGCDLNWLLTGKGVPYLDRARPENAGAFPVSDTGAGAVDTLGNPVDLREFVFIPRYSVEAAAGHGQTVSDEKPLFCMAFRRYWIENYVTRQTDKLSVIAVKGDSMEGILNHGDNILINHAETEPRDGLYVLRIGNDLFVKNIQRLPGRLLVKSANPLYEPFEIDLTADNTDIAIIGRVEWFGRSVN